MPKPSSPGWTVVRSRTWATPLFQLTEFSLMARAVSGSFSRSLSSSSDQ